MLRGRYEIGRELGRGGYSVVYLARDRELDTDVALKLLVPPPAAATVARERMRREVQAVRGLSHANIVAVFDFLEEGPWSFIVMEYVRGPDLQVRVADRGPLDADTAVAPRPRRGGGALRGAPTRHPPPRREAAEHPARSGRPGPAHRLRLRQARRATRRHRKRNPGRHAGVHRARSAGGPPWRRSSRRVRARSHALLRAHRRPARALLTAPPADACARRISPAAIARPPPRAGSTTSWRTRPPPRPRTAFRRRLRSARRLRDPGPRRRC